MNRIAYLLLPLLFAFPAVALSQAPAETNDAFQERFLETATRLGLTEEQRGQLEPILRAQFEETRALLEEHGLDRPSARGPDRRKLLALSRDIRPVRDRTDRLAASILTEDQMIEYRQIQQERRARMRAELQRGRR